MFSVLIGANRCFLRNMMCCTWQNQTPIKVSEREEISVLISTAGLSFLATAHYLETLYNCHLAFTFMAHVGGPHAVSALVLACVTDR